MKDEITFPLSEKEVENELKKDGIDLNKLNYKDENDTSNDDVISGHKWYMQYVLRNKDVLTREEQQRLTKEYKETHSPEIKELLILSNQRLVNYIASKFEGMADMEDLCQEGTIGLMHAIEMFDPDKGYQLSTYATWWIRQAISRYLANHSSNIRIPVHLRDDIQKFQKVVSQIQKETATGPSLEELKKRTGFTEEKIKTIFYNITMTKTASLSVHTGYDEGDGELGDLIEDPGKSVEDIAIDQVANEKIYDTLKSILTEKEYDILCRRAGVGDYQRSQTLEEIGNIYHVSRERIRQIEERAIRKTKRNWKFRRAWAN